MYINAHESKNGKENSYIGREILCDNEVNVQACMTISVLDSNASFACDWSIMKDSAEEFSSHLI